MCVKPSVDQIRGVMTMDRKGKAPLFAPDYPERVNFPLACATNGVKAVFSLFFHTNPVMILR